MTDYPTKDYDIIVKCRKILQKLSKEVENEFKEEVLSL